MKIPPKTSPLFKTGDPCTKGCAYADAVGAPLGYSCMAGPESYCDHFEPQIKNITAIIVVEMQDGSTQSLNITLDDTKGTPEVLTTVEEYQETDDVNFWTNKVVWPSAPTVTLTIKGTGSANPYLTIRKDPP